MLPTLPQAPAPEDEELDRKKARLAELEAELADRELELASLRADLLQFEKHYLQTVGRRYAILDDLKAKIAEARARQNPANQQARDKAKRARARAHESSRAVGDEIKKSRERSAIRARREHESAERQAQEKQRAAAAEPRIIACQRCGQKLRVPTMLSALLGTCRTCANQFTCPPG